MPDAREIASKARYDRVWRAARERQDAEVKAAIEAAVAEYGERINCAFLHRYLKFRFPFAVAWICPDHVLTEIGGVLYDKNGPCFERAAQGDDVQVFNKSFRWPKTNDFLYEDEVQP